MKNGDHILVTGGTGLVGSHLLLFLTEKGHSPRALYRSEKSIRKIRDFFSFYGKKENFEKIKWIRGDVQDITGLDDALQDIKTVFHVAGLVSFAPRDKKKLFAVNVEGTANMVNVALDKGVKYFLHVSSVAALNTPAEVVTEKAIWSWNNPHHVYAASKYMGEMEVWRGMQEGLNGAIVNPSIVLGPGFWDSGFGLVVRKLAEKKMPFTFPGVSGYVDARDVARIMWELYTHQITGERFILNAGEMAFNDVLKILADTLQVKVPQMTPPRFLMHTGAGLINLFSRLAGKGKMIDMLTIDSLYSRVKYDNSRIKEILGTSFIPPQESLRFMAEAYKKEKALASGRTF